MYNNNIDVNVAVVESNKVQLSELAMVRYHTSASNFSGDDLTGNTEVQNYQTQDRKGWTALLDFRFYGVGNTTGTRPEGLGC